jgi:transcriptional regulator with XRE-family HTH domain
MTDDAYGATIAKRRLSERLAELRLGTGYTANHVCDILNWGRGKVGRFEANQWKRPEMSDVRDLLRIYGVSGSESDEVEELAMKARARPWWRDFPEIFDGEFPGYENDATSIGVFMPLILPGLMQTEAYTKSLLRTGPRPPAWRRKALEARLRRQEN